MKFKLLTNLVLVCQLFVLVSCASTQSSVNTASMPTPKAGESGVYIYRSKAMAVASPKILLNGKPFGKLKNNSVLYHALAPGQYNLHINKGFFLDAAVDYNFTVRPNRVTYISMKWGAVGGSHMSPIHGGGVISVANRSWIFHETAKP